MGGAGAIPPLLSDRCWPRAPTRRNSSNTPNPERRVGARGLQQNENITMTTELLLPLETQGDCPTLTHSPTCRVKSDYDETYDAKLCPACDLWLESRCSDSRCFYCRQRPARPSQKLL